MGASVRTLVLVAMLAATVAGCTSTPTPAAPPATSAASTTPADPTAQITASWEEFFNAKTPNDRRVTLLQNGDAFAAVIQAQSSNPLAASATAKVTKVTLTSPQQAAVTYTILVNGQPALADQQGVAVLESGTWKVSASSFCSLLVLENGGKTAGLPGPCAASSPSPQAS